MKSNNNIIAGVDEAGRGPLAGPVMAAAVILNPDEPIPDLRDSKLLTARRREYFAAKIMEVSLAWAVARAEVAEIEAINILQASLLAMQRAVNALPIQPEQVLIDGIHAPKLKCPTRTIISGDKLIPAISAASILAKVHRDREMAALDEQYPGYGFAQHKGYPTKQHIAKLQELGVTPIHRRTYAPVRARLEVENRG